MVLDAAAIARAARRMAHEILERDRNAERLALLAIPEGGIPVADLLAANLGEIAGTAIARGVLDVTLYRDDVIGRGRRPLPKGTRIEFSITGRRVILVEDVVFTGRTVRAAMDAVIDFGRPEAIEVATLVDRGHREFPIKVDFVGKNIPTSRAEQVLLRRNASGELEVAVV